MRQVRSDTPERLLATAARLFARKWYGTVSIAEICREAGLSNGVFYRYFESKEALFQVLLGRILEQVQAAIEPVAGGGPRIRLRRFAAAVVRFSAEHPDQVSVFREGQYRHYAFERRLVAAYIRALGEVLGREVGQAEYLFALGGLRFCAVQWAFRGEPARPGAVREILERGLFRGLGFRPERVFGGTATPLPVPLAEGARERLLRSGRALFGERGYYETNIHAVASGAGLSVGAFYAHFTSKEAFYAEVLRRVGHDARAFLAANLGHREAGPLNPLEHELRGLWLWLLHLSLDRTCYSIVREAEFVLPAAARAYYDAFAAGYRRRPPGLRLSRVAPEVDEGTAIAWCMGIAHYFGMEAAFDASLGGTRALVEQVGALLSRGLSDFLDPEEQP